MKDKKKIFIAIFAVIALSISAFFGYRFYKGMSSGASVGFLKTSMKMVRNTTGVTLGDDMSFENGAVYYSTTGWEYVDDSDSIRLSDEYELNLKRGDGILLENEELQYCLGVHTANDEWKYIEWQNGGHGYMVPEDGRYSIVITPSENAKSKQTLEQMASALTIFDNHNEVARTHLFPDDYTYTHGHSSGGNAASSPIDIPENSVEGVQLYASQGYWGVSCDIRLTADGEWILCHNETVDSTTDHTGYVHDYTLAELKTFKLQKRGVFPGPTMPSLDEWLDECKRLGIVPVIQIEFDKSFVTEEHVQKVVDALEVRGLAQDAILGAFECEPLIWVKKANRSICTLVILHSFPDVTYEAINNQNLEDLAIYGSTGIFVNQDAKQNPVTQESCDITHSYGMFIGCWTSYPSNRQNTLTVLQYNLNLCGAEMCPDVNTLR